MEKRKVREPLHRLPRDRRKSARAVTPSADCLRKKRMSRYTVCPGTEEKAHEPLLLLPAARGKGAWAVTPFVQGTMRKRKGRYTV